MQIGIFWFFWGIVHTSTTRDYIMFIHNIFGKEAITTKAQKKGLLIGEVLKGASYGLPAIGGSTFSIKSKIKSAGGRWDGVNKVWVFPSWTDIESLVDSLSA